MDERFELIIDVQAKGIRATEAEIERAQSALDALNREAKVTPQVLQHVSSALVAQQNKLKTGAAQWKNYTAEVAAARKVLQGTLSSDLGKIQGTDSFKSGLQTKSLQAEFAEIQKNTNARKTMAAEAESGYARMVAASGKGAEAERRLNSERSRGFQTSKQLQASWDAEYKALLKTTDAQGQYLENANAIRYANYDLAQTLLRTSAVLTAMGVGTVVVGAQFERAFADVERTLQPGSYAVEQLRTELLGLARDIPVAFGDITEIATLGNQLGIAGEDVTKFTETVAQFSAVTGISVQETALAFGQLGNLLGVLPEDFDRLGSAIALVGVNSAATETQIVSIAREIAPAARAAGFTAEAVIGLSGALGSIKVPPERSRSTILQFFEKLNTSAAKGGEDLENFARVVGVTSQELDQMIRSGQGQGILTRFIGNISSSDTIEITQALQQLGIAGLRTNPTIRALADNMDLLSSTFSDSKVGWTQNSELARQYGIIAETLSAKWQVFVNGLMELVATLGTAVGPAMSQFLDVATDVVNTLADFAGSDTGRVLAEIGQNLLWVVAAWAGLRGAIALATGSAIAFRTATSFLAGGGIVKGLGGLATALGIYTPAAAGATAGTWSLRAAFVALGKATVVFGVIQGVVAILTDVKGVVRDLEGPLTWLAESVGLNLVRAFAYAGRAVAQFLSIIPTLRDALSGIAGMTDAAIEGNIAGLRAQFQEGMRIIVSDTDAATEQVNSFLTQVGSMASSTKGAFDPGTMGLDDLNTTLDQTVEKVRTLEDYASDLASVWNRAFDIQFGPGIALDAVTKQWNDMEKAAKDSALAVRSYKAEIGGLKADKGMLEYWLSVAEMYGDEKRAAQIRAQLEETNAKLAETEAKLAEEKDKQSKSTKGNTDAAIANRTALQGVVSSSLDYLQALAASGASSAVMKAEADRLKKEFYEQGIAMGYSRDELDKYAAGFDIAKTAIDKVPKNVTVDFNADPALQALNEFAAKARETAGSAGADAGATAARNFASAFQQGLDKLQGMTITVGASLGASGAGIIGLGVVRGGSTGGGSAGGGGGGGGGGGFYGGGYTGPGGMFDPAGIVHRGEYVIPKRDVNQRTGLPYADALGRLQRGAAGRSSYAGGGFVNPSTPPSGFISSFGPMAEYQMRQAFKAIINMDGERVAENTGRHYANGTALGSN